MTSPDIFCVSIEAAQSGLRLDKALSDLHPDLSRARIQSLIAEGCVSLNDRPGITASTKVKEGDRVEVRIPPPVSSHMEAESIALDIVYEDEDLVVINKPAGLVVHPGAGNRSGTLVHALLHHCGDQLSGIGGVQRPGIVHRLDKDTSGLMIVAKTDSAHRHLAAQLSERTLKREYRALVLGVPVPLKGSIDRPLGRHPSNRQRMAITSKGGREARTHYHVIESFRGSCALVACRLETGRTHQIRVHMASIKHPLIGDPTYGPPSNAVASALRKAGYEDDIIQAVTAFPRQALHACALSFVHPGSEEIMVFERPLPDDMDKLLNYIR